MLTKSYDSTLYSVNFHIRSRGPYEDSRDVVDTRLELQKQRLICQPPFLNWRDCWLT